MYGTFFLNTNFLYIPSFLLDFTCFLTTTRYPVSNHLMILSFFISLCLRLLSYTRILNNSICLNRIGDAASKLYKACFPSEVPFLKLSGYRSIVNGNFLPIPTTDRSISVPYTGTALQACSAKNTELILIDQ